MRFRLVAGLVAIALCSRDLRAQRGADGFSDLRIDGNGIDALSTTVGSGFEGQTTAYALTWIAPDHRGAAPGSTCRAAASRGAARRW